MSDDRQTPEARLLAEVPFFQLLDEEERDFLAQELDVVHFDRGHLVFNLGDPGDSLYVIRSGEAEVFFKDDTGSPIKLETLRAGDFFGEISLFDEGPRTAAVKVIDTMEALRVDRGDLDHLLRLHPDAAFHLLAAMGRRMRTTAELLRHTASRNVNEEVADNRTTVARAADWIAEFSGSISFLMIHVVIFAAWILMNVGRGVPGVPMFDPFPFGLLTMSVSLEAIILSVFVLLSQNRQVAKDRVRGDIEYDVNLKAELEVAHLHEKVDHLTAEILKGLARIEKSTGAGARTPAADGQPARSGR